MGPIPVSLYSLAVSVSKLCEAGLNPIFPNVFLLALEIQHVRGFAFLFFLPETSHTSFITKIAMIA